MKKTVAGKVTIRTACAAALTGALLVMSALPACAQPVKIDGEACPLPVEDEAGTAVSVESLTEFEVYGVVNDRVVVRYIEPVSEEEQTAEGAAADAAADPAVAEDPAAAADPAAAVAPAAAAAPSWRIGYVTRADMESLLPQLDLASLPDGSGLEALIQGSRGDAAAQLQTNLIQLGYLAGTADGAYGAGTADAVLRFQSEHGLDATGSADVLTQMAVISAAGGTGDETLELTYPAELTTEEKFAAILDQVDVDLAAFTDTGWRFSYDRFTGSGTIDSGLPIGSTSVSGADIDRIEVNASLKVIVARNEETERLDIIPAVAVESKGAYRPYVQSVILMDESGLCELTGGVSTGALDGAWVEEAAYVPLTAEAEDLLRDGQGISLRIMGRNQQYDLQVEADADRLAAFLAAAEQVR